jgi:hypothetical protein
MGPYVVPQERLRFRYLLDEFLKKKRKEQVTGNKEQGASKKKEPSGEKAGRASS